MSDFRAKRGRRICGLLAILTAGLWGAGPAMGQIVIPGADGSDGVFAPPGSMQVDLSLAPTGTWNGVNTSPGNGVYDPNMHAVVFRYSSVNISTLGGSNIVTFNNHPSRAPVVWLVSGDVTIDGSVKLDGIQPPGGIATQAEPGPGGFRGGGGFASAASPGSGGYGPGGGDADYNIGIQGSGGYGTVGLGSGAGLTYGNDMILPLIGGSGGSGFSGIESGGAGGGAILIAAGGNITLNGSITANGGLPSFSNGWGASGGAIRLIADTVSGSGSLRALGAAVGGGSGGTGRIRVEANSITLADAGAPAFVADVPGNPVVLWPPATSPTLRLTTIAGLPVPADPRASLTFPNADVSMSNPLPVTIQLEGQNFDPTMWSVNVRIVLKTGPTMTLPATALAGSTTALSTWEVQNVQFGEGFAAIQARAVAPPVP